MSYSSSSAAFPRLLPRPSSSTCRSRRSQLLYISLKPKRPRGGITCLRLGVEEISELAHNKVLIASTLASAIGQLSKPLTSAIGGKGIDWRAAVRSGGMPSTHSASVVAAATLLGLERGFSDSIFGMSVVFAAIVMYDAQGVRKEVGYHAQFLNMMLSLQEKPALHWDQDDATQSTPGVSSINSEETAPLISVPQKANMYGSDADSYSLCSNGITSRKLSATQSFRNDVVEPVGNAYRFHKPLNEFVGHTRLQVIVGALLGFVVSVVIDIAL
ncbi:uncharacterized protein [Typha angustifolia]|uniref:uncharacterized protein n=1 Tax=Typha angustifolia TaxID=59011 RepID=UPI003C306DF7